MAWLIRQTPLRLLAGLFLSELQSSTLLDAGAALVVAVVETRQRKEVAVAAAVLGCAS